MNHIQIRNEVRKRVVTAASIDAVNDLKTQGADFDSSGKLFWIEEYLIGGAIRSMSNARNKVTGYMIQYDLCAPVGTSLDLAESKASEIETALINSCFVISGIDCLIKRIKTSRSESKNRNAVSVLISIDLNIISS